MILLGWNCRGMRQSRAVRALLDVQKFYKPDVLFLSETHLSDARAERLMRKLGFQERLVDPSDGRAGGLLMMWRNGVSVTDHGVTANFIDVTIDDGRKWRCTGFYGELAKENKHKSWEYLRGLHQMRDEPWIAFGD